jgi:hypothetical protein
MHTGGVFGFQGGARTRGGISVQNIDLESLFGVLAQAISFDGAAKAADARA